MLEKNLVLWYNSNMKVGERMIKIPKNVFYIINKLNKEKGITIILITHFMEEAENADRVIVMDNGEIVADGTPNKVFSETDLIKKAGLALPQTVELLSMLNENGFNLEVGNISPKSAAEEIFKAFKGERQ